MDIETIQWLPPWKPLELRERGRFEAELKRELAADHLLYKIKVTAIGRRIDCDEVLYRIVGSGERLAVVHLTYGGSECESTWPHTEIFESVAEWIEARMKPDNVEFEVA